VCEGAITRLARKIDTPFGPRLSKTQKKKKKKKKRITPKTNHKKKKNKKPI